MGSIEEEDLRPLIKQIAPSSVQRIVAGAAVTDLASAGGLSFAPDRPLAPPGTRPVVRICRRLTNHMSSEGID